MRRVLKSIVFAFLIMSIQVIIYKIYFSDAPDPIPFTVQYKDFPAITKGIPDKLVTQIKRLNSPRREERLGGIGELKNIGDKAKNSVKYIIVLTNDEDAEIRKSAFDAIEKIGGSQAVEGLTLALKDKKPDNRLTAARILVKLDDDRAVDPLIAALDDDNWDVRFEVSYALKKLTGKDFGVDRDKWRKWRESR